MLLCADEVFCGSEALCEFPPKSVQLRKPFGIQPWIDSEENVGNLLMVCIYELFSLFCNFSLLKN